MEEISSSKCASVIATILDDKQGKDIVILNISNISVLADYFVICSSDSPVHVKALTEAVREKIKNLFGRIPIGEENDNKNKLLIIISQIPTKTPLLTIAEDFASQSA